MRFTIHTIEETLFDGEVERITLPTESGEITVLDQHQALITLVTPEVIRMVSPDGRAETLRLESGGFLEVKPEGEGVILLAV
ncbi:MAG: hypothetical protein A3B37_02070 [Candidatus Sungbacteria bacterium RIFCSPLOWO2_01_FULL_59_16]|uniref:ATP synthase F1 complex delta/epsilon subunit N-terminal domain-containing protein n=1 Tax=Candidatus Sungbacteria bacterium RIFCSPLOWO2_01_FULL_59_16 TaxID=1802280 RepID=A0A1G2LCX4_9BACT|nr:MAG: hypothetical protein A3B37_02070 [Candidatus Sungbacteria bacterium RIFCSPLOWO2_01_FULL_59_16]